MKLYAIGDVHGKIFNYKKLLESLPADASTIQLGDMGLGFEGVYLPKLSGQHKFIRGNHDSPSECREHLNYLGEFGYDETLKIFYLGGGYSIDRDMRIEGVSWWRDEELSFTDLENAIQQYREVKPRIVVSHECPQEVGDYLLRSLGWIGGMYPDPYGKAYKARKLLSRTAGALQTMFEAHQPEYWFFGHYHVDKVFWFKEYKTEFRVLNELSVAEVPLK